jgi:zinc transporter ZupT
MNPLYIAVPFMAGLAGGAAGIYIHGRITKDVKILLAFSGAYLLALAVLHILPDIYHHLDHAAGGFILSGFILQMVMDYFSKGVEHGHVHHSDQHAKRFPLGIYVSLFVHSMVEGMPLSGNEDVLHHGHDHHTDALLTGISLHKIPEAIALAALLYHYYESKKKVFLLILIYALATPLGMVMSHHVLEHIQEPEWVYGVMLSIAVGIFLHVSTTIIFEAEDQHKFNWKKAVAILLGMALVMAV